MKKVEILGVLINDTNIHRFISSCNDSINQFTNICVSMTGAHGIICATKDEDFYNIINELKQIGFSNSEVEKISGKNWLNFYKGYF